MSNDVQAVQQEIPTEVLAQAKKILEKKQEGAKKAAENAEKYPGVMAGTCEYDPAAGKYLVLVKCVQCGEEHTRYTSDLWQTKGLCPTCRATGSKEAKKVNKILLAKAMEAIQAGLV